jgi:hypothetical protein
MFSKAALASVEVKIKNLFPCAAVSLRLSGEIDFKVITDGPVTTAVEEI